MRKKATCFKIQQMKRHKERYRRFMFDELKIDEYQACNPVHVWVYVNHNSGEFEDIEAFSKRKTLQLSVLTKEMVIADTRYYNESNINHKSAPFYKPYFYQFDSKIGALNHSQINRIVHHQIAHHDTGGWFQATISNESWHLERTNVHASTGISIAGSLSFSVDPYQFDDVILKISFEDEIDMNPPIQIPLDKYQKPSFKNNSRESDWEYCSFYDYRISVYDVGQANYVYIRSYDGANRIMFDIGRPCSYCMPPKGSDKRNKLESIIDDIDLINPTVFIVSHWHFDHVSAAFEADDSVIKNARWITPNWDTIHSRWVENLAGFLVKNKCVFKINDPSELNEAQEYLDCPDIEIGMGTSNSNLNNRSLILVVGGNAILPADCEYAYWPEEIKSIFNNCEHLLVPHHGAAIRKGFLCSCCSRHSAYISVDERANNYGHPDQDHIDALRRDGWNIIRTDQLPKCCKKLEFDV